jgi:predicted nucleic acid-binding protein
MTSRKIRVFLDTNVLLAYFQGKAELQHLFSKKVRERAAFVVNGIVLQELILSSKSKELMTVEPYLDVADLGIDVSSPEFQTILRDERHRHMHVNDILILVGARACDVLLTYDDQKLVRAGEVARLRPETPEEFLYELGVAA